MKTSISVLIIPACVICFAACIKKDRTCECKTTNSATTTETKTDITYLKARRKDVKRACADITYKEADGSVTTKDCHIKLFNP